MLRNTPDTQMGQAVMVLCHLALTQAQLTQLPKAVFKVLLPAACGRHVNIVYKMHRAVQQGLQIHVDICCVYLVMLDCSGVAGSDDDQTVPSNPDLLTQTDEILQPCLSCQHHFMPSHLVIVMYTKTQLPWSCKCHVVNVITPLVNVHKLECPRRAS